MKNMTTLAAQPLQRADFDLLISWFPDEVSVVQWAGPRLHAPLDCAQLEAILAEQNEKPQLRTAWTVRVEGTIETIGHFQLAYDRRCQQAALGRVAISPLMRGRGYGLPLARLALETAFADPELHRLELRVFDFNETAIAVYEKAGFSREGMARESCPVAGAYWNTITMSMLRQEWMTMHRVWSRR